MVHCKLYADTDMVAKVDLAGGDLNDEIDVMWTLRGIQGVPSVVGAGTWNDDEGRSHSVLLTSGVGMVLMDELMKRKGNRSVASGVHSFMWDFVSEIAQHIVATLTCMHTRGVLHRDISPKNIVFVDAEKRWGLIDFGSAGNVGAADANSQRRAFGTTVEFASDRLLWTTEPLSADDDFVALCHVLTYLLAFDEWEVRGRHVNERIAELVTGLRMSMRNKYD